MSLSITAMLISISERWLRPNRAPRSLIAGAQTSIAVHYRASDLVLWHFAAVHEVRSYVGD